MENSKGWVITIIKNMCNYQQDNKREKKVENCSRKKYKYSLFVSVMRILSAEAYQMQAHNRSFS